MSSRNNLRYPLLLLLFSTTISLAREQEAFSRQQPEEAKSYHDLGVDRYKSGRQSQ